MFKGYLYFLVKFVLTNEIIGFIPQLRVLTDMSIQSLDFLRASNINVCSVPGSLILNDSGLGATFHLTTRISLDPYVAIIKQQGPYRESDYNQIALKKINK